MAKEEQGIALEEMIMKRFISVIAGITMLFGFVGVTYAAEKHLFYIHGCCVSKLGGAAYEDIVKKLKASGFKVMFDLRTDDSESEVKAYAEKVADQVKGLLTNGTAPERITISGFSLGSVTAMYAAISIANPKVNYVLLAGCPGPRARTFDLDYAKIQGRVLSVIDNKDDRFGSCKGKMSDSVLQQEIAFDSGHGHALFRLTDETSTKLWMDPLERWSKRQ